jgi:hypothetical protein
MDAMAQHLLLGDTVTNSRLLDTNKHYSICSLVTLANDPVDGWQLVHNRIPSITRDGICSKVDIKFLKRSS